MYTFAFDFWKSKTTHLALVAIGTAVWAHWTHQFPLLGQLALVFGGTAVAFLRDAHIKSANDVADLLQEILHLSTQDPDGEADRDGA